MKSKVVGRSALTIDPVEEACVLLETLGRLRGPRLVPRGLYRFGGGVSQLGGCSSCGGIPEPATRLLVRVA